MSRQTEDKDIYQKATQEKCCVVTIDDDFKMLSKPKDAGVVIIPAQLTTQQIEKVLLDFIKKYNFDEMKGKLVKVNQEKE